MRAGSGARRCAAATATSPRAGCRRRGGASTRSARRGTRATRRSRSRCGRPTRAAPLPLRRASTSRAPSRPGRDGVAGHPARRDRGAARSRSRAAATRCSATTTLAVIPQTSTIASHLPRARRRRVRDRTGGAARRRLAVADGRGRRLQLRRRVAQPRDRAGRRSTAPRTLALPGPAAAAAVRLRGQRARDQRAARPRAGSSRRSRSRARCATSAPTGTTRRSRSRWRRTWPSGSASERRPAVLHLRTVRYLSHAGADVEAAYRTPQEIRADWDARPAPRDRRAGSSRRARSGAELADEYLAERERVRARRAGEAAALPQLDVGRGGDAARSRRASPLGGVAAGAAVGRRAADARAGDQRGARRRARAATRRCSSSARTSRVKGGVYGVTRGLQRAVRRRARVRHAARRDVDPRARARHGGQRASCRCRRSSTSPTSTTPRTSCAARRRRCSSSRRAQYRNGMVVRLAGYGYQKGFGGHFHNDNAIGVLRDMPGLVIASPATAGRCRGDAAHVLESARSRRQCLRVPRADRAVPHPRPVRRGRRVVARVRPPSDVPLGAARTLRRRRAT